MRAEPQPAQRPRIVALDRDAATRGLLADELENRYGRDYDVVIAASTEEARSYLSPAASVEIALVLADRTDSGAQLLATTRSLHPQAKRVLLIGWNEHRTAREEIAEALDARRSRLLRREADGARPTSGSTGRSASSSTTGGDSVVGRSRPWLSSARATRLVRTRSATSCTGTTSPTRSTTSTRTRAGKRSKPPASNRFDAGRPRRRLLAAHRSCESSKSPKRSAREPGPATAPTTSS